MDNTEEEPDKPIQGTSTEYGLRRLARESENNPKAAALRQRVLQNEVSVNAALVELGNECGNYHTEWTASEA